MLTAAAEHEMLARLLELATHPNRDQLAADLARIAATIPVGLRDQQAAAARDTIGHLGDLAGTQDWCGPHEIDTPNPTVAAMTTAALLRCLAGHHCEHATRATAPLIAFPAARVIACRRCMPRYRGALAGNDKRVANGTDTQCDLCLNDVNDGQFTPHALAVGPALTFVDVCGNCDAVIASNIEAEHAS